MSFQEEKLAEIDKLMKEGRFQKAIEIVDGIKKQPGKSKYEQIDLEILRIQILFKMGNFDETLRNIKLVLAEEQIEPFQIIDALLIKLDIKLIFGEVKNSSSLVDQIESLLSRLNNIEGKSFIKRKAGLGIGKARVLSARGDMDRAMEYLQNSLSLYKEIDDESGIASSLLRQGRVFDDKGFMKEASEKYQKCLDIREKLNDKSGIAEALNLKGRILISDATTYEEALECCQKALEIQQEIGNKFQIGLTLENLVWINRLRGELITSKKDAKQMLSLSKAIDHQWLVSSSQTHLGVIYGLQGDVDKALEHLGSALKNRLKLLTREGIAITDYGSAWSYNRLGKLYREKEDYPEAKRCFQESLIICKSGSSSSHKLVESEAFFYLVSIGLEENNPILAQKYLESLGKIVNLFPDNIHINQRLSVAQAIVMKSSSRLKEKMGAQNILTEFLKQECGDHDLIVRASIILCELLIEELHLSGNLDVLDEVKEIIMNLKSIAKVQPSFWLLAEVFVFQSRLALLDLDLGSAEELLEQAFLLAEEKGLKKLTVKIFSEKTEFEKQVAQWEQLIARDAPLNERLNLIQLENLLERIAYKKIEISDEETIRYAQRAKQITQAWDS